MDQLIIGFKYILILLYYIAIAKILMIIMDKVGELIGLKKLIQRLVDRFFKESEDL